MGLLGDRLVNLSKKGVEKMRTIAAISTPAGVGGIGIIRISGEEALNILQKVFKPIRNAEYQSYHMRFGYLVDEEANVLDQALVSYFKAPKTYTGEDICEINCHGGTLSTKKVLELVLRNGATLAEPGEFTKRAFLNGKMDLTQAEAVIDLINSKSEKENKASLKQLEGVLGNKIRSIKASMVDLLVDIEANIDYPEYDIEEVRREKMLGILIKNVEELEKLEQSFHSGKILREGVLTAIIGRPNVGKSSLLNTLVKEERAIVTEVAGTTRDTIEEYITIKGIPLKIVDTAGIHKTSDIVEEIGVNKSMKVLENADLVLMMLDATQNLSSEDQKLLDRIQTKNHLIIINKIDIGKSIRKEMFPEDNVIEISAKTLEGMEQLENKIEEMFSVSNMEVDHGLIVTNVRHQTLISKAKNGIQKAIESIQSGIPIDMISIDLQDAIQNLGEMIGESISEDVVKGIFAKFCVGK